MKGLVWQAAQIPAEIERTLVEAIDENGEIVNEIALARLESLAREKTIALTDLGSYIKEDLDVKIGHLHDMIAHIEAQAARFEKARGVCLKVIGDLLPIGEQVKTPLVTLKWHPSEAVVVDVPPELLPEKFQRFKTTCDADKKALKDAIKAGEEIDGVKIEKRFSLQVK